MNKVVNPEVLRQNLNQLLHQVNKDHRPLEIEWGNDKNNGAVLIAKSDWDAIKETLYLAENRVGAVVRKREKDDSGSTNIDDIDWNKL